MGRTGIEQADFSFSPWIGCVHMGTPGMSACDNCYADAFDERHLYEPVKHFGKDAPRYFVSESTWKTPFAWNRLALKDQTRYIVFLSPYCDVMERRPDLDAPRKRLWEVIEQTPQLDWTAYTKRPHEFKNFLPSAWLQTPKQNLWLLTTFEAQRYEYRVSQLLDTPAVVHGLSVEPMLTPIRLPKEFLDLGKHGWVVAGGESGHSKFLRPTPAQWFRYLRDQCLEAGVPFFFKQWGEHLDLVRIGKHEAGRILDGRTWDEYPEG